MFCIAPGMSTTPPPSEDRWDVQRRFIRIVQEHDNGMVEFEFAVGEPGLYVEMVMPRQQFEEFCAMQAVVPTHGRVRAASCTTPPRRTLPTDRKSVV